MIHNIVIPGIPTPWQASRVKGQTFFNPKDVEKKSTIWNIKSLNLEPLEGPIKLDITFYMPIPASYSKKKKEELRTHETWHTKKPDRTNLQKFIEDCLELAGVISNDSFVVNGTTKKQYGTYPRTEICISEIGEYS